MDTVRHFLFDGLGIRGAVVRLGPAWHDMQARRNYAQPERDLLGELAAVTALIGSNLKQPGRVTFQLQGEGPLNMLVMDCDEQLRMRGMAKPRDDAPLPAAPVPQLIGNGQLVLTLQSNAANDHHYQSHVPISGDTLSEIFEHYLEQSEQTPTRLWLAADAEFAGGLFLQKMPGADEQDADGWNRIQHLAATLRPGELGLAPEALLTRLFPEETVRLFDAQPVSYHCPRDEEKVLNMLRTFGREEVAEMLTTHDAIIIQDDMCNHEYRFGPEVLALLFPTPSRTLH